MKKIISFVLAASILTMSVVCFAAVEAAVHELQNNVYVEGSVEEFNANNDILTLSIMKDGKVIYINEYELGTQGDYAIKFKCEGNLAGATIKAKYADEDATSSVVTATATSQIMEADVFVTDQNDKSFALAVDKTMSTIVFAEKTLSDGTVLPERTYTSDYAPENRSGLKAVVNIKNKFAYEGEVAVMVAAYDENNRLLGCKVDNKDIEYGYNGENQVVETAVIDVPEGTKSAKAFCWSSSVNLIPYGKEADGEIGKVDVFCIGDSFCQTYGRTYYPESGWGGHLQDYLSDDVTVTNYGTSGAWAQSVMNNPEDLKYGTGEFWGGGDWNEMLGDSKFSEGDYVIVSLGLNDTGHPGPDDISAAQWYKMGIEDMIESAEENNVNLILCSAMLRANFKAPDNTRELITITEELAAEYGIPFLNVNDALENQYAEEFGYDETKSYTEDELLELLNKLYGKYYLYRDAFKDENHEFHLTDEERANHGQSAMKDEHTTGKNSHPNLRGADNMARCIAVLLKDSASDLRFYVK